MTDNDFVDILDDFDVALNNWVELRDNNLIRGHRIDDHDYGFLHDTWGEYKEEIKEQESDLVNSLNDLANKLHDLDMKVNRLEKKLDEVR